MTDKVTCKYCGVVPRGHKCPYKIDKRKKENTEANKFRSTKAWIHKSIEIRQRDRFLCRVCMANKYNTVTLYNYNTLEVHHIIPLHEDFSKRLDDDNLITLCKFHHNMAEEGEIPRIELQELIKEKL